MADRNLSQILAQLKHSPSMSYPEANGLLSKAKLALLQLKALTPTQSVSSSLLALARETYELGALFAIRARNPEAFTRYVQRLQPFYELPAATLAPNLPERNKVTGLSLLLLLTQGRYAEFHSELESLANRDGGGNPADVEVDRYLGYPIRLERWLMEGSYDRVWKAMKSSEVPCDEYSVFSEILKNQIRSEIASSSERAYLSLPISSTKSLLFLDSEGDVVQFAKHRGWAVKDGHIFFPDAAETSEDGGQSKDVSQMVIENTLGIHHARLDYTNLIAADDPLPVNGATWICLIVTGTSIWVMKRQRCPLLSVFRTQAKLVSAFVTCPVPHTYA